MQIKGSLLCHALLWMWLFCAVKPAQASLVGVSADVIGEPIAQFRVSGNITTQEKYIIQWSQLYVGQIMTLENLGHGLQELRDTDLFKDIHFQAERHENGEITLHIIVEERRYWLLLPRLSRNSDGDIKAGLRLRMYNLQGADRTLDLLTQREEETDGDDTREFRLSYKLPLYSKPYDLSWQASHSIENNVEEGFSNIETVNFVSFAVARDWHLDVIDTPITVEPGIALTDRDLEEPYPEDIEAREAGQFNRLRLSLIFDDEHRERYRRFGSYYAINVEQGFEWLGSDYQSSVVELVAINFLRLNFYDNFNSRVVFEVTNNSPFDYPAYGIGGGSDLRGLESVDDRGDARWFANLELILPYRKHPQLAHTFFVDVGNVYDDLEDVDFTDFRYTLGTGFRWKVESFVKTDLFLDYGYSPDEQEGKLYGGTSLNF